LVYLQLVLCLVCQHLVLRLVYLHLLLLCTINLCCHLLV
jgi:hypothetical protein